MKILSTPNVRGCPAIALGTVFGILAFAPLHVQAATDDAANLADLSLEELLNMEITTLSRKAEDLADAPAAVFVISQNDIVRSGARTIPDLLRMVPGTQVAQLDSNKWAVTARGANGLFANKLLVLMDGRSVYSPLLSGVYWDAQDTNISDIERIEVIRGPGATMWGSNAVNGVVNIITKHSSETQGGAIGFMTNDQSGSEALLRYGGQSGNTSFRVFAKAMDHAENVDVTGLETGDTWKTSRAGGRLDWSNDKGHSIRLTAETYSDEPGETRTTRMLAPPFQTIENAVVDVNGTFAQFRWVNDYAEDASYQVLAYYVHEQRDEASLAETRDTFELDLQQRIAFGKKHDLVWGFGFRESRDETRGSFEIDINPANRTQQIFSAFIQDDIQLTDKFRLMIGSKFEKNSYSRKNIEVEPSVRFSYRANDRNSFWGAISKSARTPSRGELDGHVVSAVLPPGFPPFGLPVALVVTMGGDGTLQSEEVQSFELGYRFGSEKAFIDVALFMNDNEKLRSVRHGDTTCMPSGDAIAANPACLATAQYAMTPFVLENGYSNDTHGIELWGSTEVNDWWQLQASYTYFKSVQPANANPLQLQFQEDSPMHQMSVRSAMELPRDVTLNLWLRYVDELEEQGIEDYTALDVRLAWLPTESVQIAAVGRNLIAGTHLEFVSELGDLVPVQIEPQAYLEIRWSF